jgi:ubiquitin-activating enzyme E1
MIKNDDKNKYNKINEDLYSRQIIFLGMETMKKISCLKVLIIGLRGLGIEIAKDLIVSGPSKITILDPNEVIIEDLGANFYLSEIDIGKRRDEACLSKLQKLNENVIVDCFKEITSFEEIKNLKDIIINEYKVIVVSELVEKNIILFLDEISRQNKICLIYSVILGLSSFVFTDFGPKFTIYDETCFEKRKFYIKQIERSEQGLVEIEWNKQKSPNIRNYVIFKDIKGMTEINYNDNNK